MKKTASAIISILLVSLVAGTLTIKSSQANFVPTSPDTVPPIISIISPTNKTYETKVLLHLNITLFYPDYKEINYVGYTLDNQDIVINSSYGEREMNWSATLEGLAEGMHTLTVTASCKSYYATPTSGGALYYRIYWGYSDTVDFSVVYSPKVSILSPENKTYDADRFQLDFTVNEKVSKMEYSLDGQASVLISGNTTLTGLTVGQHNLIIIAEDTEGNIGTSETTFFTTVEPFPTSLVFVASVGIALAVIGLLVYFRRKHQKVIESK